MARVEERGEDARRDLDLVLVLDALEPGHHELRVGLGIERAIEVRLDVRRLLAQLHLGIEYRRRRIGLYGRRDVALLLGLAGFRDRGVVFLLRALVRGDCLDRVAPLPARVALGELLLQPAAVEQDDLDQLGRRRGQEDGPLEALAHDHRQVPAVVEVRMSDEDGIHGCRVEAHRHAVPDHLVGAALEHAAVDEDAGTSRGEEEARPGDGARGTEERDVHPGQDAARNAGTRIMGCG